MIFVTVGTHEQPFDRLVRKIDELVEDGTIKEEVVIQTGYSTYEPKHCTWQKFFKFNEMQPMIEQARIIITHGGPSSFMAPLQVSKIPVVVPRKAVFNEHVNDHQVKFSHAVAERYGNLIVVDDVDTLGNVIQKYDDIVKQMSSEMAFHNKEFNDKFKAVVDELLAGK